MTSFKYRFSVEHKTKKKKKLVLFMDEPWFSCSRTVNSQNNGYRCSENPHAVYEVSFM